MIEIIMYFALGFLAAGLLALMIIPAIWRRAVRLTRRRIEGATPLTMAEIKADKDQLRAEFAMTTRRLEKNIEALKTKATEQIVDINRKRALIDNLSKERGGQEEALALLEDRQSDLRQDMRETEESLAETASKLRETERKLADKQADLDKTNRELEATGSVVNEQKVALIANATKIETMNDDLQEQQGLSETLKKQIADLEHDLKHTQKQLAREQERNSQLEERHSALRSELADQEDRLDRRNRDLTKQREHVASLEERVDTLSRQNTDTAQKYATAETERAEMVVQLQKSRQEQSDNELNQQLKAVERRYNTLETQLASMTEERDLLQVQLTNNWEEERMENALLRERLNDIAAEVGVLTRSLDDNPDLIDELLMPEEEKAPKKSRSKGGKAADAETQEAAGSQVISLADRIRALQEHAQKIQKVSSS